MRWAVNAMQVGLQWAAKQKIRVVGIFSSTALRAVTDSHKHVAASTVDNRDLDEIVMVSQQAYEHSINLRQHNILDVKLAEQASGRGCLSSTTNR